MVFFLQLIVLQFVGVVPCLRVTAEAVHRLTPRPLLRLTPRFLPSARTPPARPFRPSLAPSPGSVGRSTPPGSARSPAPAEAESSTHATPTAAARPTVRAMADVPPGVPYSTSVDVSTRDRRVSPTAWLPSKGSGRTIREPKGEKRAHSVAHAAAGRRQDHRCGLVERPKPLQRRESHRVRLGPVIAIRAGAGEASSSRWRCRGPEAHMVQQVRPIGDAGGHGPRAVGKSKRGQAAEERAEAPVAKCAAEQRVQAGRVEPVLLAVFQRVSGRRRAQQPAARHLGHLAVAQVAGAVVRRREDPRRRPGELVAKRVVGRGFGGGEAAADGGEAVDHPSLHDGRVDHGPSRHVVYPWIEAHLAQQRHSPPGRVTV
eukprot:scaffold2875_cov120-Isochrysis_galbana.AAC.3